MIGGKNRICSFQRFDKMYPIGINSAVTIFFVKLLQSFNIDETLLFAIMPSMLMPTYAFNMNIGLYII